eukprot:2645932-Pyramimonas_sp.AAC.1
MLDLFTLARQTLPVCRWLERSSWAKPLFWRRSLALLGISVVGVQEGRTRMNEIRPGLHCERYAGAADTSSTEGPSGR